jgi:SAM-dependent methyltransferase
MRQAKQLLKQVLMELGLDLRRRAQDRKILEEQLLPWLSGLPNCGRVLFVGCDWYTRDYRRWFDPESYWTLDYDPAKKRFGGRLHVTASMTALSQLFEPGSLDVVICNGVYGWGLNARDDVEAAFSAVATVLRPGGMFLLGWNDVPHHRPFTLAEIDALRAFIPSVMAPLNSTEVLTDTPNRHTFSFFIKPETARTQTE